MGRYFTTIGRDAKPAPASVAIGARLAVQSARREAERRAREMADAEATEAGRVAAMVPAALASPDPLAMDAIMGDLVRLADEWTAARKASADDAAAMVADAVRYADEAEAKAIAIATADAEASAERTAELRARIVQTFTRARHAFTVGSARAVKRMREDLRELSAALGTDRDPLCTGGAGLAQFAGLWRPSMVDRLAAFGDRALVDDDARLDAILYSSGRWSRASIHDAAPDAGVPELIRDLMTIRNRYKSFRASSRS